jgi:hypothetical protein
LKWFLCHGNVFRAPRTIDDIRVDLQTLGIGDEPSKLLKAVHEFDSYLRANAERIPNYGERHRRGETISTSFVESTVNQVVSKRMVKKQQMRWSPQGAHLFPQVRPRVSTTTWPLTSPAGTPDSAIKASRPSWWRRASHEHSGCW